MKRIVLATLGVCVVAVAVAALGLAQPAGKKGAAHAAAASALPPLPAEVKERGRWNIAVKCDAPPFGYIDVQGKHAGFDVEIAKWFSRFAFGKSNRVSFTCVTTPAREPALTTGRVDLVIATFTYTPDRDTRIDFSRAYYKATGRLLVRNDSPIKSVAVPGTTFRTRPAPFPAASLTSAAPSGATNTSDANGIVPGGTTSWPAAVTAVVRVSASGIAYTVSPVVVVPHPSPVKQLSTT